MGEAAAVWVNVYTCHFRWPSSTVVVNFRCRGHSVDLVWVRVKVLSRGSDHSGWSLGLSTDWPDSWTEALVAGSDVSDTFFVGELLEVPVVCTVVVCIA